MEDMNFFFFSDLGFYCRSSTKSETLVALLVCFFVVVPTTKFLPVPSFPFVGLCLHERESERERERERDENPNGFPHPKSISLKPKLHQCVNPNVSGSSF